MPRLIITSPDGKRGILELTKPVITIGRGNANDLVLNDPSVSRFHAVVKQAPAGVIIADRGSTNGVVLNHQRAAGDYVLQPNDCVCIGVYELRLEHNEDAALLVRRTEISHTLDHVLRGDTRPPPSPEPTAAGTAAQLKHLAHENYLLRVLYDAGKALHSKLSIDDIAAQIVDFAFRIEGVERGFVMLLDEDGDVSRQTEVRYRRGHSAAATHPKIILSRAILDRLKTEMEPILITDLSSDERFQASESIKLSGLRSAMCAPLVAADDWDPRSSSFSGHRRLVGILYVDNMERASAFTQEELNVFALVAAQAAAAIDSARAHTQLAQAAVQRHALERFLAPEVVEMVAANPQGIHLGGVNQRVTILFADIRGFTEISERLPPEKIVEILNEYFTRVTDVIFDHGGTLDKYLGDGVLAIFGAPFSKGNDALNAVRAAAAIQRLLLELNRDAAARRRPELRVGIGVSTGVVTAGNIGSPRRIDYTVVGDAVNVAARLSGHATAGQILIAEATAADLAAEFALAPLPPLMVKGKSEPLRVFAVNWQASGAGA
jgi:adenylate cyclase